MANTGRISSGFAVWDDLSAVPEVSVETERYSRGFLHISPAQLVSGFAEHWGTFFANAGLEIGDLNLSSGLDFPSDVTRMTPFLVNGETGLLAVDNHSLAGLLNDFISGVSSEDAEPIIAYLERRILFSIEKSWKATKKIKLSALPGGWSGEISIVGHIRVTFTANGFPVVFWIALGQDAMSLIDAHWKSQTGKLIELDGDKTLVTVNVADLSIAPAVLIDYLRIGKEFALDSAVWPKVTILLNGKAWAEGELVTFGKELGVKIVGFSPKQLEAVAGTTRISMRVFEGELDNILINQCAQIGSIMPIVESLFPKVRLVVSGEEVGSAQLGLFDDKLGVRVIGS